MISITKGTGESNGVNYQKTGKLLITMDELARMTRDKCILQISGLRPFRSYKYDMTKHANYEMLSDFYNKNEFDIERYLSSMPKLKLKKTYKVKVVEV